MFETMVKLTFAMVLGIVLNKAKVFTHETNKSLSSLIVNVTSPALAIYSVSNQNQINAEVLKLVGFGAVLYLALPILALGVILLMRPPRDRRGVYQMLLVFGNVSFMGFPVVEALYGSQAIFYINILNIPFTLLIFTYGVRLLRERGVGEPAAFKMSEVFSPGFVSAILSLCIYFLRIPMPGFAVSSLGFIGSLTTPLSMLVIGSMIADFSLRDFFAQKQLFWLMLIKLLAMPLAGFWVAGLLFQDPVLVGTVTLSLAMPSGALCAMVSRQYGNDAQANTAALGVFITTVVSMVTIPLLIFALL